MKKRISNGFAHVLFTLLLFMLVGCTEENEAKTKDKNIQTIEAVLQNSLTGPSHELKQIVVDQESEEKRAALKQYEERMNAAIKLGFLNEQDFESCKLVTYSKAISVKEV